MSRMFTASPSSTFRSPRSTTTLSREWARAAFSAAGRACGFTMSSFTWISPWAVIVTLTPVGAADATAELGRSTFLPCVEITDVVTIKMISSTRKMSVSGVMLISATMSSPVSSPALGREWMATASLRSDGRRGRCRCRAGRFHVQERLDEALAAACKSGGDSVHAYLEIVVEAEGHEGFGDAGGHDREPPRALHRHLVEGADDADHRAEEADEGRQGADRAEDPEPAAQLAHGFLARSGEHAVEVFEGDVLPAQSLDEDLRHRVLRRRGLAQRPGGGDVAFGEMVNHPPRQVAHLGLEATKPKEALDHDRERHDRREGEGVDREPALLEQAKQRPRVEGGGGGGGRSSGLRLSDGVNCGAGIQGFSSALFRSCNVPCAGPARCGGLRALVGGTTSPSPRAGVTLQDRTRIRSKLCAARRELGSSR